MIRCFKKANIFHWCYISDVFEKPLQRKVSNGVQHSFPLFQNFKRTLSRLSVCIIISYYWQFRFHQVYSSVQFFFILLPCWFCAAQSSLDAVEFMAEFGWGEGLILCSRYASAATNRFDWSPYNGGIFKSSACRQIKMTKLAGCQQSVPKRYDYV